MMVYKYFSKKAFLGFCPRRTDGRKDGRAGGRVDGRTGGRAGGRADGRTDGWAVVCNGKPPRPQLVVSLVPLKCPHRNFWGRRIS